MPPKANHRPRSASIINLPSVGILSYRKKVRVGSVAARLKELAEQEIPLAEIAIQYGFEILAIEVMPGPVHMYVSAPPSERSCSFSPAAMVHLFKGITLRKLKKAFSDTKHPYSLRR